MRERVSCPTPKPGRDNPQHEHDDEVSPPTPTGVHSPALMRIGSRRSPRLTTSPTSPRSTSTVFGLRERGPRSEEPLNDREIDDHTSRAERRPVDTGEKAVIDQGQNLEFLPELRPIPFDDGISRMLSCTSGHERRRLGDRLTGCVRQLEIATPVSTTWSRLLPQVVDVPRRLASGQWSESETFASAADERNRGRGTRAKERPRG